MRYQSTRGRAPSLSFAQVALAGLAPDGGLYVPERWPTLSAAAIADLRDLPYAETAARVLAPFVGDDLDSDTLRALLTQAYADWPHPAVTPLVQLDARHWLLDLFHGPTLAFKDLGLQWVGALWHRLIDPAQPLTVIGATSGDTGSAAIAAVAGRPGVEIFMLHPHGRVTDIQRRQMTTQAAVNVHNLAVDGNFDDCQALVKQMFNDAGFAARLRLSAVNSINWARLLAQVAYYFYAAVRLGAPDRAVGFSVPTGNFGDVFAGHVAACMGLPISRLLVATNENDIVVRAIRDGRYAQGTVTQTITPSMDIQVSSNFERLLWDMNKDAGGDPGEATAALMQVFERERALVLPPALHAGIGARFAAASVGGEAAADSMRWAHDRAGVLIDPHTAVALAAARADTAGASENAGPLVTLATAHPAKFPDAVFAATGVRPELPARARHILDGTERFERVGNDLGEVERLILQRSAFAGTPVRNAA